MRTLRVQHLTPEVLKLILAQPDLANAKGRRDVTLLVVAAAALLFKA